MIDDVKGECMSKKIVVAVFFVLALVFCYQLERNIYKTKTYSFYKELKSKIPNDNQEEIESKEILQQEVFKENQIVQNDKKIAYLTFDDGPSKITPEVLKVLEEKKVNATFFLIGNQITEETIPILKQSVEDGNCIGVHTYCHEKETIYCSVECFLADFDQAYNAIKTNLGVEPKIFRFPWGSANGYLSQIGEEVISTLEAKGFTYFDWNVSAEDSVGSPSSSSIMSNIKKDYGKYNQPVILMHDSCINSVTAQTLPQVIDELKAAGYEFDTLDHMQTPCQYPRD